MLILNKKEILSKGKNLLEQIGYDPIECISTDIETGEAYNGLAYTLFDDGNIESYSYYVDGEEFAVCCIVVIDYNTKEVIEKKHTKGKIDFPYIPGCLAFREMPLILETVEKLEIEPDLYVFDGNGYLHPRHMGIATHAGIVLNKPSIGVAKSYFKVHNTDYIEPNKEEGSYTDIIIKDEV